MVIGWWTVWKYSWPASNRHPKRPFSRPRFWVLYEVQSPLTDAAGDRGWAGTSQMRQSCVHSFLPQMKWLEIVTVLLPNRL